MRAAADLEGDSRGILDPGRMREHVDFCRLPVDDELGEIVEWCWAVRWSFPPQAAFTQPVLAHPTANFSVGPVSTRGVTATDIEATAVGVHTGIDSRHLTGEGWNVAAKLRPGGLGLLLSQPAAALTNRIIGLDIALAIDTASMVAAMISAAGDVDAQAAELVCVVRRAMRNAPAGRRSASREAVRIASLIETDRSIRSVAELAERTGYSSRSLQRICREHAGVSPLWMIRRYRLIDAAEAARCGASPAWSELAGSLGYADQAHLIRDFKATIGMTPAQYAASVRPMSPSAGADQVQAV